MSNGNFASIQLSAEEIQRSQQAIAELKTVLEPKLRSLTYAQRRQTPRIGDGSEPFVEKAVNYARNKPEFVPSFLDVDKLEVDFQAMKDLDNIIRPLQLLLRQLEDSTVISGREAYIAALAYYNNVKLAVRHGVGGAKTVYEDLRQRFDRNGPKAISENEDTTG
jgi:hypothetical protein